MKLVITVKGGSAASRRWAIAEVASHLDALQLDYSMPEGRTPFAVLEQGLDALAEPGATIVLEDGGE